MHWVVATVEEVAAREWRRRRRVVGVGGGLVVQHIAAGAVVGEMIAAVGRRCGDVLREQQ